MESDKQSAHGASVGIRRVTEINWEHLNRLEGEGILSPERQKFMHLLMGLEPFQELPPEEQVGMVMNVPEESLRDLVESLSDATRDV